MQIMSYFFNIFSIKFYILSDFNISYPILISSIGSDDKDTLIVSPIPCIKSWPIPIEDLMIGDDEYENELDIDVDFDLMLDDSLCETPLDIADDSPVFA